MKMKKLNELTTEEVKSLLSNNNFLKKRAEEDAQRNADFMIDEILAPYSHMHGINYNIGYPGNFFHIFESGLADFLTVCKDHVLCIFSEETEKQIEKALAKLDIYEAARAGYDVMSEKNYERLEKWLMKIANHAAAEIVNTCEAETDYSCTEEAAELAAIDFCEFCDDMETDGTKIFETYRREYA